MTAAGVAAAVLQESTCFKQKMVGQRSIESIVTHDEYAFDDGAKVVKAIMHNHHICMQALMVPDVSTWH